MSVIQRASEQDIKDELEVNKSRRLSETSAASYMGQKPHVEKDFFTGIYEKWDQNEC